VPLAVRRFGDEGAFRALARDEGFGQPSGWSNAPHDTYPSHEHGYAKLLMCVDGSITFHAGRPEEAVELHAGEGFVLPPRTSHRAVVGPDGCSCVEAHRPA
jgi:quercetin dioxygenase-like cupin family protein